MVRLFKDVPRTKEEAEHYERALDKAREEWEHRHEPLAVSFATTAPEAGEGGERRDHDA